MKKIATMFFVLLSFSVVLGQISNFDDFNYGENNGPITNFCSQWVGTGDVPSYSFPGLTKVGYTAENIGGQLNISSISSGSIYKNFEQINTNQTIFISFLIKLSSVPITPDNFFSIGSANGSAITGKIFAKLKRIDGQPDGWCIGLQKADETISFTNARLQFGRTYIVILKYSFDTELNDQLGLWIYYEPLTPIEGETPGTFIPFFGQDIPDVFANPGSIVINQSLGTPTGAIDGIRISNNWSEIPLPVELTSFTSFVQKNNVELNWTTATELNNFGFDVERSTNNLDWTKLAFVNGQGSLNTATNYTYNDNNLSAAKYYYRLKQIDHDGSFTYSNSIFVDLENNLQFVLEQNYPNPFNPTTLIEYNLPDNNNVKLLVYNSLGETVQVLENSYKQSGSYKIYFNASELPSGIYFYKLEAGSFSQMKKMILMK
ncbi:MAG: T9SS type A sorting domain-containing protein [Syntrophothermus sp.]